MTIKRVDRDHLVERVVERTGNSTKTVEKTRTCSAVGAGVVDAALEEIYTSIKRGESVSLRNFGTFYVRPERSTWVFRFNPSQRLRRLLGWSSTYQGEI